MMYSTVTPRTYSGYGAKRPAGGGSATSSSKRGAKGVVASVKRFTKVTPKRTIAKLVQDMAEKKQANNDPTNYAFSFAGNGQNTACYPAVDLVAPTLDAIGQGVSNGQRIGNRIRIHQYELRLNFAITPAYAASASYRPGYVQLWIATLKDSPSTLPNATDLGRIYDDGGGASGPDGTMLTTLRDLNRDYFNFKIYKMFKIGASGFGGASAAYANNDFPACVQMKIPDILKGEVRFNDTTAVCNKYAFMFMTFTACDNVPLATGTPAPVDCTYYINCKYSDI